MTNLTRDFFLFSLLTLAVQFINSDANCENNDYPRSSSCSKLDRHSRKFIGGGENDNYFADAITCLQSSFSSKELYSDSRQFINSDKNSKNNVCPGVNDKILCKNFVFLIVNGGG